MSNIKINKKLLISIITILLTVIVCSVVIIVNLNKNNSELNHELSSTTDISISESSSSNINNNTNVNNYSPIDTNYVGDDVIVQYDIVNNTTTYYTIEPSENSGTVSTEPYIPDGMPIANTNELPSFNADDVNFDRDINKVSIKIKEGTLTKTGATIIITDKNEPDYGWGKAYKIQKNKNDNWFDLQSLIPMSFEAIGYILDENGQFEQKIDWTKFYGELKKGNYRIVKSVYDNSKYEYIDLYAEFTIE